RTEHDDGVVVAACSHAGDPVAWPVEAGGGGAREEPGVALAQPLADAQQRVGVRLRDGGRVPRISSKRSGSSASYVMPGIVEGERVRASVGSGECESWSPAAKSPTTAGP